MAPLEGRPRPPLTCAPATSEASTPSLSHYKRLLMLKPSVTSAPTADMATLTVVQPLTLDRGKGATGPSGHTVRTASPSALPSPTGKAGCARSGAAGGGGSAQEGFAPGAGHFLPLSPRLLPPPLLAALAGAWVLARARMLQLPVSVPCRVASGPRLCWRGCARTAERW